MNHGDIQWTFTNSDDTKDAIDQELKTKLTNYKSSLVGIFGEETSTDEPTPTPDPTPTPTPDDPIPAGDTILCTFSKEGVPSSDIFTVVGNGSNSKGTATVDGQTLSTCLKMESATSVKFTLAQPMTMTLYFADTETVSIKIDGKKVTGSSSTYTTTLEGGQHELTKADSRNLFAIKLNAGSAVVDVEGIRVGSKAATTAYDLNGRSKNIIKKGLYIVNGKKAVVR